jgi:hypothetical protein
VFAYYAGEARLLEKCLCVSWLRSRSVILLVWLGVLMRCLGMCMVSG